MLKKCVLTLRVAFAQINPTLGDIKGNAGKIISYIERAKSFGADIVVFPELSVTGSPPNDLFLFEGFAEKVEEETNKILSHTKEITAIVGSICESGPSLFNTAYIMSDGRLAGLHRKRVLKEDLHFNEKRYFTPGEDPCILEMEGIQMELMIGEEMMAHTSRCEVPFHILMDSSFYRANLVEERRRKLKMVFRDGLLGYVNLIGGQDEWIFYGGSFLMREGRIVTESPLFKEHLLLCEINVERTCPLPHAISLKRGSSKCAHFPSHEEKIKLSFEEEILSALILATGDYVRKNGFKRVFIGLSGGIDSALVTYIASRAVGSENVTCLFMPTRFTSRESYEDARKVAQNMEVGFIEIPIDELFESYIQLLKKSMGEMIREITIENLQPRIRANILMAFSNNLDGLVLATGNRSEVATGYCTLYGDTSGGFSVLRDVPKTLVYKLAKHVNKKEGFPIIPERILRKAPSAELKYNQKDSDVLPPYPVLDAILAEFFEEKKGKKRGKRGSFDRETLNETLDRVLKSEYKRRQSPPGPILSTRTFGKEINLPITNLWRYT